jgi:hypothetical protein
MFHYLASAGISEPILWIVREQSRDYVLQAVPPPCVLRPLVVQHQNVVVHQLIAVSLERLDAKQIVVLEQPSLRYDNNGLGDTV